MALNNSINSSIGINSVMSVVTEIQDDLIKFLISITENFDKKYQEQALEMLQDFQDDGYISLKVDDEIWHQVQSKLEKSGVPFMCLDNQKTDNHVFIAPSSFAQMLESSALVCARDADRLTEISKDEINDLCYEGEASKRYELNVDNKVIANRLREALTKNNNNKCPFSMTNNPDKTVTFACTYEDLEKLNKAYFETLWHFAGRYAELNRKQEEYDLKRQEELENRLEQPGHYFIVDPEIDNKGSTTGKIKEMVEITDESIMYYKNGSTITETIQKENNEEFTDRLYALIDKQSRPIVIENNEMANLSEVLIEKNPKIYLDEKDLESYKQDKKEMIYAEKKMDSCLKDPLNEYSIAAISDMLTQIDKKRELAVGDKNVPIAEEIKTMISRANPKVSEITSYDLSTLDRVLSLENEKIKENREKQRGHILQTQLAKQNLSRAKENEK